MGSRGSKDKVFPQAINEPRQRLSGHKCQRYAVRGFSCRVFDLPTMEEGTLLDLPVSKHSCPKPVPAPSPGGAACTLPHAAARPPAHVAAHVPADLQHQRLLL